MALDGLRVISFESRRAAEIATLIEKKGGQAFVAPSVSEVPQPDPQAALEFTRRLEGNDFEMIIFMTGVGLRLFLQIVSPEYTAERIASILKNLTVVARGPKPAAVLRELGVAVDIPISEPNTWREIIHALGTREERKIAMLEHGRPHPDLVQGLQRFGMEVITYAPYHWELPPDPEPLREAARRVATGNCDVVMFTSSVQVVHLLEVAREMGIEEPVRTALRGNAAVASIGPMMTEALEREGLAPDIVPEHPKMGTLVHAVAALAPAIVQAKRLL
jgi:uroporphyrinogen-III synthase